MTREEAIELINTSDNCYSLREAKEKEDLARQQAIETIKRLKEKYNL